MRTRMKRSLLASLAALGVLCATVPAMADARTEARTHFRKGMSMISDGQYDEGIAELKVAYDTLPHANVLYNIARAYVEMGDLDNAIKYYKDYAATNPPDKEEVAAVTSALEQRLARQRATLAAAETSGTPAPGTPGTPGTPAPGTPAPGTPGAPAPGAPGAPGTGVPGAVPGEEAPLPDALKLEGREEDIYEESVAAASKGAALSPLEAPNSVTIITQQDIRLSGMTKLSDLFRRVAGIDVMDLTNGYADMSMRGFNQRMSNKLLVLVDGRSVQNEFFGNTFYEWMSIDVDQIDRVEIVRGPGSALYGADAFSGVVNIVTRAPGTGGNSIRMGGGPLGEAYGSLRTAGRTENLAYRMSAGYTRYARWSRLAPDNRADLDVAYPEQNLSAEAARFDFRSERRFSKDVNLSLSGGYTDVFNDFYAIGVFRGFQHRTRTGFVQTNLRAHELSLRVSYSFAAAFDNQASWAYQAQTRYRSNLTTDILDTEFVYADDFKTGSLEHVVNLGINYKYRKVVSTFSNAEPENFFGFFGQEALKVSPLLTFVASGRLDYLPYTEKWETSPRLSVLVHPTERSTIRGSFATAFRKPTALEGYMQLGVQSTTGSVQALNDSTRAERLEPERVLNAELGYINQDIDWLAVDTALYYNRVTDLVVLAPNTFVTPSDRLSDPLFDQNTGRYVAAYSRFTNQCAAFNVFGGELGARVFPVTGLDIFANYALNKVSADRPPGCDIPDDERTSAHKINLGVQVRSKPGIDGEVTLNHVTSQVWSERIVNAAGDVVSQDFPLEAYTLLNARLGYRFFQDRFEVSAMGFNLLNDKHKEHPFTQTVGRRFMTFAQYNF